jgi:hypothetical protein
MLSFFCWLIFLNDDIADVMMFYELQNLFHYFHQLGRPHRKFLLHLVYGEYVFIYSLILFKMDDYFWLIIHTRLIQLYQNK